MTMNMTTIMLLDVYMSVAMATAIIGSPANRRLTTVELADNSDLGNRQTSWCHVSSDIRRRVLLSLTTATTPMMMMMMMMIVVK